MSNRIAVVTVRIGMLYPLDADFWEGAEQAVKVVALMLASKISYLPTGSRTAPRPPQSFFARWPVTAWHVASDSQDAQNFLSSDGNRNGPPIGSGSRSDRAARRAELRLASSWFVLRHCLGGWREETSLLGVRVSHGFVMGDWREATCRKSADRGPFRPNAVWPCRRMTG